MCTVELMVCDGVVNVLSVECDKCFHIVCWQALVKRSASAPRTTNSDNCYACTSTQRTAGSTNTTHDTSQQPTVSVCLLF